MRRSARRDGVERDRAAEGQRRELARPRPRGSASARPRPGARSESTTVRPSNETPPELTARRDRRQQVVGRHLRSARCPPGQCIVSTPFFEARARAGPAGGALQAGIGGGRGGREGARDRERAGQGAQRSLHAEGTPARAAAGSRKRRRGRVLRRGPAGRSNRGGSPTSCRACRHRACRRHRPAPSRAPRPRWPRW